VLSSSTSGVLIVPNQRTLAVPVVPVQSSGSDQRWQADVDTSPLSEGVA